MRKIGLRFIGVVKMATFKYPMLTMSSWELGGRGSKRGLVRLDDEGKVNLLALTWVDRERCYFVSS